MNMYSVMCLGLSAAIGQALAGTPASPLGAEALSPGATRVKAKRRLAGTTVYQGFDSPWYIVRGDCQLTEEHCLESPNYPLTAAPYTVCMALWVGPDMTPLYFEDSQLTGPKASVSINGVKYSGKAGKLRRHPGVPARGLVKYASKKSTESRLRICPMMEPDMTNMTSRGSESATSTPRTIEGPCEFFDSCFHSPNYPSAADQNTVCDLTLDEHQLVYFDDVALPGSKGFVKVNGVKYKGDSQDMRTAGVLPVKRRIEYQSKQNTDSRMRICQFGQEVQAPLTLLHQGNDSECGISEYGCFYSGGFLNGSDYAANEECTVQVNHNLIFEALHFDTEEGFDTLMHMDGRDFSNVIAVYSGGPLESGTTANFMSGDYLVWETDGAVQRPGFMICPKNLFMVPSPAR